MALLDDEVLVVDTQTTSSSPKTGRLIELGWARTLGDLAPEVNCHLVALPPDTPLPRPVSRITGITRADLEDAEDEATAWTRLRDDMAAMPAPVRTVIHYARFERVFLQQLQERHGPEGDFPFDIVCTHEIAKRLLPDLPRRNLRAIAGFYGFDPELLRRSDGHVLATVHVWRRMSVVLAEQGVTSWSDVQQWLADTKPQKRSKKRGYPMMRAERLALPDAPGVYRFRREGGGLLYVGKAISLRKRVNSYFTKRRGHDERLLEMLSQAKELDVTETHTALEAAMLETDEIKMHRPAYNKALRHEVREVCFATADLSAVDVAPDQVHRVGPLPSAWSLRSFNALCDWLEDPEGTRRRERGQAMGSGGWDAPSPEELAAGLTVFRGRYEGVPHREPRRELLSLSKHLALLARDGRLDQGPRGVEGPRPWDPYRVARHLERVTLQMGRQLRRARWLCLLSES
ncbi:MAG: exonuclease domain-containing protein, partial [Myxococcota bacterium]